MLTDDVDVRWRMKMLTDDVDVRWRMKMLTDDVDVRWRTAPETVLGPVTGKARSPYGVYIYIYI